MNYPFVECATFADEIKSKGFADTSDFHFVDNPFLDDGYKLDIAAEPYNITWMLVIIIHVLVLNRVNSRAL